MKADKAFGLAVVTMAGAFLLWRLSRARNGVVTFVDELDPGPASVLGSEGSGDTNPFTAMFNAFTASFKAPGNSSPISNAPARAGTAVDPLAPPRTLTLTAQPEQYAFEGEDPRDLPTLADPNFSAWDYLATTPPDLAWGLNG